MVSKIDRIVATFTKTVNSLRKESERLDSVAMKANAEQVRLSQIAQDCDLESERALKIATNLEGLLNV